MAPVPPLTLAEVNALSLEEFNSIFGNVIESCSNSTIEIEGKRPFHTIDDLIKSYHNYIDTLNSTDRKLLVQKHPDLSSKICKNVKLSNESQNEQELTGICKMEDDERNKFDELTDKYREKFSFPFLICVRENTVSSIISEIKRRLMNDSMTELSGAVAEIKKICTLRLNDLISVSC